MKICPHLSGTFVSSRRFFARPWRLSLGAPFLVAGIIGALLICYFGGEQLARLCGMLNGMILSTLLAAGALILGMFLMPPRGFTAWKGGFRPVGKREVRLILAAWIAVLVGSSVITEIWQQLLGVLGIPFDEEQLLVRMARQADAKTFIQLLCLTAGAVPLAEELIFRRCLYELLQGLGARAALILGAFIFGIAHGFLLGLPGLCFIGAVFQGLCNATRNLCCSILCHALLNASVLVMARTAGALCRG